jgi:hypothetical protein
LFEVHRGIVGRVSEFLSPAWFADRAGPEPPADTVRLTIQQRVTGCPDGDVAYVLRVLDDAVHIAPGTAAADVTITEDYATARAVHTGELTPAAAVAGGRVKISGAVSRLVEHAALLERAHA